MLLKIWLPSVFRTIFSSRVHIKIEKKIICCPAEYFIPHCNLHILQENITLYFNVLFILCCKSTSWCHFYKSYLTSLSYPCQNELEMQYLVFKGWSPKPIVCQKHVNEMSKKNALTTFEIVFIFIGFWNNRKIKWSN